MKNPFRLRSWLQFSLKGLLLLVTLLAMWLAYHVHWLRERQAARQWIEQHEAEGRWSRIDPRDVWTRGSGGVASRGVRTEAPWSLRLLGESRLVYIYLDKGKLSEDDIARIDSLPALFPEAQQVQIVEPGWTTCWPPPDPVAFLK